MWEQQMALLLGGRGRGLPLAEAVRELLAGTRGKLELKIGCPFVSDAGLEALVGPLDSTPRWSTAPKAWLVGVHHGITEPAALRTIHSMPRSECRLFTNGERFSTRSLRSYPIFHAKIISVEKVSDGGLSLAGLIVSSANLTRAALGNSNHGTNYEAGASLIVSDAAARTAWPGWWLAAWNQGLPLTPPLIEQYERFRDKFLVDNRVVMDLVDPPSSRLLASAPTLWIQAGAMSGGSRNQVEFNRELAAFFADPIPVTRTLTIRAGGKVWNDRPLSYKITTYGVEIWRFSLPTAATGGFDYPDRILRFKRDPSTNVFTLDVTSAGSRIARRWRADAVRAGYVGMTSGNREFGLS